MRRVLRISKQEGVSRSELMAAHHFHPVGQGLFYTGAVYGISSNDGSQDSYRWAYDCGTHSSQPLVKREIKRVAEAGKFDLLVLSHFDADHISGVADLITSAGARAVMLPYMPLWERLAIAFDQGLGAMDELAFFFINPAAYLASLGENAPERVIFVPRSDGGEPPPLDDLPPPDGPPPGKFPEGEGDIPKEKHLRLKDVFQTMDMSEASNYAKDFEEIYESSMSICGGMSVDMLRQGGRVTVLGCWEFVPYNDPTSAPRKRPEFEAVVSGSALALLAARTAPEAEKHVRELKRIYDHYIRKKNRNRGSLYIYAGPIHNWKKSK